MLTHLDIRDFAIVRHVALELSAGMTVLTGETGAGKSILVDALGLVLGERASAGLVREGAERAEVTASFEVADLPRVQDWLREQDLDQDRECVLRRTLNVEGRSRAYVNARPAPVQSLKDLGNLLVDIHGQHAHQSLLRREAQRRLLDEYGRHGPLLESLAELVRRWRALQDEAQALGGSRAEREAGAELLRYQVRELEALAPDPDEIAALDEEHVRLSHAGRLLEGCQRSLQALYGDDPGSAWQLLQDALRELSELRGFDERLAPAQELVDAACIQAGEAAAELRRYADGVELDPERLAWVEQRIADLHALARKHQVRPAQLHERLSSLSERLQELERGDARLRELEREREALEEEYARLAARLSERRAQAAAALSQAITANMQELGMPGGLLNIELQPLPDAPPAASGRERVEFLVAANPGQTPQPLGRVASGGELSRISLAIQVIGARGSGVPVLIFDEVDVGVGGRVAEIVGKQLRLLGRSRQVLCVTHLPQVASQGHHHLQVLKLTDQRSALASVNPLSEEGRVEEIARMLGGIEITEQTTAHALEMITRANG